MKHKNTGIQCLVLHYDTSGHLTSQCIMCENCKEFIRPENMNDECYGVTDKCIRKNMGLDAQTI